MKLELLEIIKQIFPSFNPYIAERIKQSVKENISDSPMVVDSTGDFLQGDIFEDVEFIFFDDNGEPYTSSLHGMVLSNTCDISRNDCLIFVPIFSLKSTGDKKENLKTNIMFHKFYLNDFLNGDYLIGFDYIQHIPRVRFENKLKNKRIKSLTLYGFYMLIIKLSIYLLRIESDEVVRV